MSALPTVPYIPDNAPFDADQRAWLNGFLAGLFTGTGQAASNAGPQRASLKIGVFFASQTGTAERLAKKLAKELKGKGHTVELASLQAASAAILTTQEHALLVASTYGEGDPPDDVKAFRECLLAENAPRMEQPRQFAGGVGDFRASLQVQLVE